MIAFASGGCATSSLEPWHSAKLTEDFSAKDGASSFADYLEIERLAFDELDAKVYSQVGRGPEYALVRYSRGSASDPEGFSQNYNRSYELPATSARGGVLLLHGMSDSPYSLWALARSLHDAGFHVINLRLPGHGTAPAALTQARWQDFAAATELAMAHLGTTVANGPVHIVGFSNGAPVAVNYALDALADAALAPPASLILIAPAIGVTPAAGFAGFKDWLGRLPGMKRLRYTQIQPAFDPFRYGTFPTNGATQTHRLTRRVASSVSRLEREGRGSSMPPILVIKSSVDATVSNDAVIDRLLGRLPDNGNELILFDVNRLAATKSVLVSKPGPFADRLKNDARLPFAVTLVANESDQGSRVVASRKPPHTAAFAENELLEEVWPPGVVSLSHIALTFPPDDPLYGRYPHDDPTRIFLGEQTLRGERGILRVPDNWFTRQRYNPFYSYLERRVLEWCVQHGD